MGSSFEMNSASEYGAGIAVGDGAALNVSQSTFAWNGATRGRRLPPIVSAWGGRREHGSSVRGAGALPIVGREEAVAHPSLA